MAVTISGDWEQVVKSFRHTARNNDLRLIRRNDYRFETTNEPQLIERFYDDMYVPFINSRHEADTVVAPKRHIMKRAKQGKLLRILRREEVVAAGVVYPKNGILYFLWMGLPSTLVVKPPEGAISALYYFGIRYAFDKGYESVDFTGTRPFLNDGAFRFKRKWRPLVKDTFSPNCILVKPKNNSENAAAFSEHFPLVARRGDGLEAMFLYRNESVDADILHKLTKQYGCDGLDRMTVIEIADENDTRLISEEPDGSQFRLVRCRMDCFADYYARRAIDNAA
jgi:hypothetical protein